MKLFFKKLSQWTHKLYKSFHGLINLALITIIIIQILVFTIENNNYKITIPEFLLTKIRSLLHEKNLSFNTQNITLKLTGEIDFDKLEINYIDFSDPLVTCDRLKINLSLISLLFGNFKPENIIIKNATFFCPPSLSPTGLNEPIIKNFFGALNLGKRHTRIEQFDFDFDNITVITDGSWSHQKNSLPTDQLLDISQYLHFCKNYQKIRTLLTPFHQPVLTLQIKENQKNNITLTLNIHAANYSTNNITLGPLTAKTELLYNNHSLTLKNPIVLSTKNLSWNNTHHAINAKNAQAQLTLSPHLNNNPLPFNIQQFNLSLNEIQTHNLHLDTANIHANLTQNPIIPLNIDLVHNNNWISSKNTLHLNEKSISTFTQGNSTLTQINQILSQFLKFNLNNFNGEIHWKGHLLAHYHPSPSLDQSNLTLTSTHLQYQDIPIDKLYAETNFKSNELSIPYINLEGGENFTKGSIYHNFNTQNYRYLLTGAIIPDSLNNCLGPWWKTLISKFNFTSPMPFGNMDVQGNSLNNTNWSVFGEVQANNFTYLNTPIKQLSLRINSNEQILELMDLHVDSPNGILQAYTLFNYTPTPPYKEIVKTTVAGFSSLPPHELDTIINSPPIHNILKEFSSAQGPYLKVTGTIDNTHPKNTHLSIQTSTDKPIRYHTIPFEYLSFNANYTHNNITINNIISGFAQGQALGSLTLSPKENSSTILKTNLQLNAVNLESAIPALSPLWTISNPSKKKPNNYEGLLNLNLQTTGILGDWTSFTGSGTVAITQANLGKINLFWILSDILNLTPLNIGSLNFTNATSTLEILNGAIHFPNINIYGSTASIEGEGNFYLGSQNLDFYLDFSPLNTKGIPILSQALLVLTPITQSFQMHLTGTLQNPKWETSLTPLGLFKKKGPNLPDSKSKPSSPIKNHEKP